MRHLFIYFLLVAFPAHAGSVIESSIIWDSTNNVHLEDTNSSSVSFSTNVAVINGEQTCFLNVSNIATFSDGSFTNYFLTICFDSSFGNICPSNFTQETKHHVTNVIKVLGPTTNLQGKLSIDTFEYWSLVQTATSSMNLVIDDTPMDLHIFGIDIKPDFAWHIYTSEYFNVIPDSNLTISLDTLVSANSYPVDEVNEQVFSYGPFVLMLYQGGIQIESFSYSIVSSESEQFSPMGKLRLFNNNSSTGALMWHSSTAKSYSVSLGDTDLNNWSNIASNIPGSGTTNNFPVLFNSQPYEVFRLTSP